ncbi:hypothetical protein FACS1894219_12420 [Clostridia bacterium]|nr:hypothetical protein FACS1894219_12420 [Clostridia bacterium]
MNAIYRKLTNEVAVGGTAVLIDSDYRTVLRCISLMRDSSVPDAIKFDKIVKWFYRSAAIPEGTAASDMIEAFAEFVSCGESVDSGGEALFDFDTDAPEIYASFLAVYKVDLAETEFLHWHKFLILLRNLPCDCALLRKIAQGKRCETLSEEDSLFDELLSKC